MTNRREKTWQAFNDSVALMTNLGNLSQLNKWHKNRINVASTIATKLVRELFEIGLIDKNVITDAQKPSDINDDIIFIPVDGIIKHTFGGAIIFSMPGFIGGWYKGEFGPLKREDHVRSIPETVVKVPFNPAIRMVGVERHWYEKPGQRDIREYVNTKTAGE